MKAELGRPLMMMMAEVFNTTSSGMMCDCYCDYCWVEVCMGMGVPMGIVFPWE